MESLWTEAPTLMPWQDWPSADWRVGPERKAARGRDRREKGVCYMLANTRIRARESHMTCRLTTCEWDPRSAPQV